MTNKRIETRGVELAPKGTETTTPGMPGSRSLRAGRAVLEQRWFVLVCAAALLLGFAPSLVAGFDSISNLAGTTSFAFEVGVLALAELVVIVSGSGAIDLSVGSMVSLTSMVFGFAAGTDQWHLSPWISVVLTVAIGALLGAVNGWLVAYAGFPALIVTLATLYGYGALAVTSNSQKPISSLPDSLSPLVMRIGPWPLQILAVYLPIALILGLFLRKSLWGRRLYAIGTNDAAARYAAVNARRVKFGAFVISGLLAGVTGVITSVEYFSARPDAGVLLELKAITVAVLGGVAITGGVGGVLGVVVATLLVTWLNQLLTQYGAGTSYQLGALGVLLIVAAALDTWRTRRRREIGLLGRFRATITRRG